MMIIPVSYISVLKHQSADLTFRPGIATTIRTQPSKLYLEQNNPVSELVLLPWVDCEEPFDVSKQLVSKQLVSKQSVSKQLVYSCYNNKCINREL